MVHCPECETDLDIEEDEVDEGEIVSCPECGTDFEIITVSPIELKPVDEETLTFWLIVPLPASVPVFCTVTVYVIGSPG